MKICVFLVVLVGFVFTVSLAYAESMLSDGLTDSLTNEVTRQSISPGENTQSNVFKPSTNNGSILNGLKGSTSRLKFGEQQLESAQIQKLQTGDETNQDDKVKQAPAVKKAPFELTSFQKFVKQTSGLVLPQFGYNLFDNPNYDPVANIPVTPDYLVGPGDELIIRVWGSLDAEVKAIVDRTGQINLPSVGTFSVTGVKAFDLDAMIRSKIARLYKNFDLNVSLGQLRSIQIYAVGQAAQPGRYTVSSLSTLVNAVFASGGPSPYGSMRHIQLKRSGATIADFDLYDFIAKGNELSNVRLLPGDVIVFPPAGPKVALSGATSVPAIYEMKDEGSKLQELIDLSAGKLSVTTSSLKASLERIDNTRNPARSVEQIPLDRGGAATVLKDGDVVTLFPISSRFENGVSLERAGASVIRLPWKEGMHVRDIIQRDILLNDLYWQRVNQAKGINIPKKNEINWDYATIQRLNDKELNTEVFSFALDKAIAGDALENLELKAGDLIKIYNATQILTPSKDSVALGGSVLGGVYRFPKHEKLTVKDLLHDQQWIVDHYNYWQQLKRPDIKSLANGTDTVANSNDDTGPNGEQNRKLPTLKLLGSRAQNVGSETTLTEMDPQANGNQDYATNVGQNDNLQTSNITDIKNQINWEYATVVRQNPSTLGKSLIVFNLQKALKDPLSIDNIVLEPDDLVNLFSTNEMAVPQNKQLRFVTVEGEVSTPGVYQLLPGETLRRLLTRVGGLTPQAYLFGTEFTREETRKQQQLRLDQSVQKLELSQAAGTAAYASNLTGDDKATQLETLKLQQSQQKLSLDKLKSVKSNGRIALELPLEATRITDFPNLPLEDGDHIKIPSRSSYVAALGAVNNDNAILWKPHRTVGELTKLAGANQYAELDNAFVLRADGTVVSRKDQSGWLFSAFSSFDDQELMPGDTLVVPEKIDRRSGWATFIAGAKDWTQIIYQLGLGAAAIKVLHP
jgi:protein involved in polysaccharide export with SLBB domain